MTHHAPQVRQRSSKVNYGHVPGGDLPAGFWITRTNYEEHQQPFSPSFALEWTFLAQSRKNETTKKPGDWAAQRGCRSMSDSKFRGGI
jgi:hypothetical protein